MLPAFISSCGVLRRLRANVGKLCRVCSSQQIANSRCSLSLSCQTHKSEKDSEDFGTEEGKVEQKFRKHEYSNPFERTFGILKDDVVSYYKKRRKFIEDIAKKAQSNAEANAKPASKNIYGFEPSSGDVEENIWPSHCDVLVVGGGAMGSSIAYHIKEKARGGLNVVVVEEDPGYKKASTVLSVGGIRQQFSIPENIELSMYGMEFLRNSPELLAVEGLDTPDIQFNPNGYLTLASEEGYEQLRQNFELQIDMGAKVSFLTKSELSKMYPWLNVSGVAAGVLGRENEGWFDPWSLLIGLQRKAISLGTQYISGKVTGFSEETMDDVILEGTQQSNIKRITAAEVTLPSGETRTINFAILVAASGAWTGELGRMAGIGEGHGILSVPIPIEPRKRYVYCVHAPDGPGLQSPLLVDPNGTYFRREGLGGLYLCGQSPPEDKEPNVDDLDVDYSFFNDNVWLTIAQRVPAFEKLKLHSSWAGYYDYNAFDQNGIIGLHPLFSNFMIASGFSGHGIQQAPGIGRAVMECIMYGGYETINLERFGFERVLADVPLFESNIV
ncbi:FAD-dependent oxidoreductase domain-containing protein 1-like isoform X2 [Portunus trituberculatus]|uniref:FAD-dependent oxidoreductase domain-containing protein 1-like isoform X2 n=1 Tax=Portunus trituberculatus TaxID=210409 RepID=UPI001E1CF38B|nr:FAD-dependent oxidoreductase domain-containing protein 1-like isoform X2 [Portunus trituberculatus]